MYLGKDVRVFLRGQAKEDYATLQERHDKEAKSILKSINRTIVLLKENPQHGDPIPKRLIPEYMSREGIHNLYRVELSNYWRLLYTVEGNKVEILMFVLSISDHKRYSRILGYK